MEQQVKEFLQKSRISVLGVLQNDNIVHSSTLHFAYGEDPLSFFFMTEKASRKCSSLLDGMARNGSLVIGFSEEEFVTFQAEGTVKIVTDEEELKKAQEIYFQKYSSRGGNKADPSVVLLQFIPTWWRYRDYKTTGGPIKEVNSAIK